MRKLNFLPLFTFIVLMVSACSNEPKKVRNAVGGKQYGGAFKFMSSEIVDNLFPISSVKIYSQRINSQLYESLLKLDLETMKVLPSVASSFQISKDGTIYTFKIRKGVFFHDDACFGGEGRELTAYDVKYTLDFACSGLEMNKMSHLFAQRIRGASEFQKTSKNSLPIKGVSGIKVVDNNTISIQLLAPYVGFEKLLTHPNIGIFPKEAYDKYGKDITIHPVGTGPFRLEKVDASGIVLVRNDKYWKKDEFGNQLPFLDKVVMSYSKNKKSELLAFRQKDIDLVLEIPVEEIDNILGSLKDAQEGKNVKHKVESTNSMSMNYIAFALESDEFKNANVRKAINMAVDRNEIVEKWLLGEGWAAENGFVPNMQDFAIDRVKGVDYNISKAQSLLAQAGFPNGKGFPVLDFYVNAKEGSASHKMCMGIASQIKRNLNIDLNIKLCTIEERDRAIMAGEAKIWRSGWVADYPDAENFLSLFYSKNIESKSVDLNAFRFRNKIYDQIFEKALVELDKQKRQEYLTKCDQIIVDEAAVIPILTDDFMVMVNARIRNFKTNAMETLDFSELYIKEPRN